MGLLLHSTTSTQVEAIIGASAGGYVFHGPVSVGKAATAREIARRLNCQGDQDGLCGPCRQFEAGTYPDYVYLAPEDKASITIDQVRRLTQALSLGLYYPSGVRLVVINEADQLTVQAQNALLKLIEEPPLATRFILVAKQPESLLPTVRSRLGAVYFAPVSETDIEAWLVESHGVPGAEAARLAGLAEGAPGRAMQLLGQQEGAQADTELAALAEDVLNLSLFERLVLAKRLVDTKANLPAFAGQLHQVLLHRLASGSPAREVVPGLEALECFRRQLEASVGARVATERLMVEL